MDWATIVAKVGAAIAVIKDPAANYVAKFRAALALAQLLADLVPDTLGPKVVGDSQAMATALAGADPDTVAIVGKLGDGKFLDMFKKLLEVAGPLLPLILPLFLEPTPNPNAGGK